MKPTHRLRFLLIQTSAALALLVNHATAATFTWDGSASTSWNTATNWVSDSAPGTGGNTADVIIAGTSNVATILLTTNSTYTLRSLTFDATNDANTRLVLAGAATTAANTRPLTFSSDSGNATLTVDADSTGNKTIDRNEGAATINLTSSLDVIHNGSGTLTLGNSTNTSNLGGAGGINKSGTGTLVLASVNTYTGATTISGGSLQVGAGGTTGRLTATTAITNNSNLTINRSNAFTQAADLGVGVAITGTGSLTQAGAGTTTLTAANTYTGTTLISKGRLQFAKAVSLYNGATASLTAADLIVASGAMAAFNVGGAGEFTSGNLDTLTALGGATSGFQSGSSIGLDTSSGDFSYASVIANPNGGSNALSLTKLGINTLTLSGNNTFTGGVTVSASGGKVIAGHNNALGSGTVALAGQAAVLELAEGITVANAMTVSASGNPKTIVLQSGATSATYAGNIVNSEDVGSNFDLSASTGGTLTISGIISSGISTAGLETVGAGTVTLTGANTYTGGTTVTTGTLTLAATGSIATSSSVAVGAAGSLDTSAQAAYTIPGTQPLAFGINATGSGSSGKIVAAGLNISSAVVTYNITGTPDDSVYVLATYTSLTGTFASVPAPPAGYTLDYAYQGNKIALVLPASNNYASWADDNGIPGEPASGDFENDGISNVVEYALGTSPTVSTQPAGVLSGNVITFTKGADAIANGDVSWVIETSQTLAAGSWTAVVTQPAADPALTISYTLTPSTPVKNFARLKVTQIP
jgi:autotransporter-associated beta strand protein